MTRRIRHASATYEALVVAVAWPRLSKCQQRKVSTSRDIPLQYSVSTSRSMDVSCITRLYDLP
jgi:hypothetical protein